jgi:hypothetical protein
MVKSETPIDSGGPVSRILDERSYVFRGDDRYQGGPVGRALGADAADIQDFADHVLGSRMNPTVQTSLVASGNTYNPCLIVLREKGYELWLEKGDERSLWCARKDGQSFLAYSGPELLGLVALWEHFGEDWNRQQPDVLDELHDKMED